jgi:hypothetical protein
MRKIMKRALLNEVLSQKPDKPLYHYTTQRGILGIIGAKELWVTHTQYLNDRREFLHAVDLTRTEIKRLVKTHPADSIETRSLIGMENALQWKPENINVCVCSFSEDRDSLSQWRAYGARTSGFAIGFPADLLTSATDRKGWYLAPCVYKPAKQREIIRLLVEEVLEEHLSRDYGFSATEKDEEGISLRGSGGSLLAYLNRYAPILKDESFSEEKEWRVISRPLINQSADFSFREGQSLLIPYSKFPLSYDDMPFRLKEVVIGPTPDPERSRSSITNFLVHRGVLEGLEVEVSISSVPYRDW